MYIGAVPRTRTAEASATMSMAELAATVSAPQVQLVGVQSRMTESEAQNESLRETIVNLTQENQLLKCRIYGNKTERTQTSELQLSLGNLLDAEKQLQKQLDDAVAKAKADGDATPLSEKPKAKPTGGEISRRATCLGSSSRSSTRSSKRPRSGLGSRKASTSCTAAAASRYSSSARRSTRFRARMGRRC